MGQLEKMNIYAYTDPNFADSAGAPYVVNINPEKYSHTHTIEYNIEQASGTAGASSKFDKTPPETVSMELVFDATGAVNSTSTDASEDVKNFKKVVYDFDGDIHSPKYLILSWGPMVFKCRLTSLEVSYTLFKPDGTALRAKANVSFQGYLDAKTLAQKEGKSSPDLTHTITVKAGDSLPNLCYKIYRNANYYIEVAKYNKLIHYRNIQPGTVLYFPPIQKKQ